MSCLCVLMFLQNPNVLTGIVDATQTLYPFLTFNQDLMMEILKKVRNSPSIIYQQIVFQDFDLLSKLKVNQCCRRLISSKFKCKKL